MRSSSLAAACEASCLSWPAASAAGEDADDPKPRAVCEAFRVCCCGFSRRWIEQGFVRGAVAAGALTLAGRRPAGPVQPVPLPKQPGRGTWARFARGYDDGGGEHRCGPAASRQFARLRAFPGRRLQPLEKMPTIRSLAQFARLSVFVAAASAAGGSSGASCARRPPRRPSPWRAGVPPGPSSLSLSQNSLGEGPGLASLGATTMVAVSIDAVQQPRGSLRGFVPFLAGGFSRWRRCRRSGASRGLRGFPYLLPRLQPPVNEACDEHLSGPVNDTPIRRVTPPPAARASTRPPRSARRGGMGSRRRR